MSIARQVLQQARDAQSESIEIDEATSVSQQCFDRLDKVADSTRSLYGAIEDAKRWLEHAARRGDQNGDRDMATHLLGELSILADEFAVWQDEWEQIAAASADWKDGNPPSGRMKAGLSPGMAEEPEGEQDFDSEDYDEEGLEGGAPDDGDEEMGPDEEEMHRGGHRMA